MKKILTLLCLVYLSVLVPCFASDIQVQSNGTNIGLATKLNFTGGATRSGQTVTVSTGQGVTGITALAGNIGINSTAPGKTLDVAGTVRATNFDSITQTGSGTNSLIGNLGVGTTDPSAINANYSFAVFKNSNAVAALGVYNPNAGTSTQSRVEVRTISANGMIINFPTNYAAVAGWAGRTLLYGETGNGASVAVATGDITFLTGNSTEIMRLGTNVGISSTAPGQKLDVQGTIRSLGFVNTSGTSGAVLCLTANKESGHCTAAASCTSTCTCTCVVN